VNYGGIINVYGSVGSQGVPARPSFIGSLEAL